MLIDLESLKERFKTSTLPVWQRVVLGVGVVGATFFAVYSSGPTVPKGYHLTTVAETGGGRLVAEHSAVSAEKLLRQSLEDVASFFDGAPNVAAAFRDRRDSLAQALFQARLDKDPVAGAVLATTRDGRGIVQVIYGPPKALGRTIELMVAPNTTRANTPAAAARPPTAPTSNWQTHRYPDGSGQLSLPEGWRITVGQRGLVGAVGPHGMLHKGLEVEVRSIADARMMQGMGMPVQGLGVVADPVNPASAMAAILPQVGQYNGREWRVANVRAVAPYPVQYPLTQAAFIDADEVESGQYLRCLVSAIISNPQGGGMWIYAQSQVCDRPETFLANLPVLLQIWGSAETSPAEFQRRYGSILRTMTEIGDIVAGGQAVASRNTERGMAWLAESLRGTRVIQELGTGREFDANLADSHELARALTALPGSPGYVAIPLAERQR